jgi:hypothetical protein
MKTLTLFCCALLTAAAMQAQIIHVPGDYTTIQQGINAANPGDTVLVAEGTYYEQINFLGKKPLMVASQFLMDGDTSHISNAIIDGSQLTNMDSASVVYFVSGEDTTSILCGFTITGGRGTFIIVVSNELDGGGIWIENSGATIRNNIITNNSMNDSLMGNSVAAYGGGISSVDSAGGNAWVVIENNEISHNTSKSVHGWAVAGGLATYSNTRIINNIISENVCIGISDSTIAVGAGMQCGSVAYPIKTIIVQNNRIINNRTISNGAATYGGGVETQTINLTFTGNSVSGNENEGSTTTSAYGGGMYGWDLASGSRIANNEFISNTTNGKGGGIYLNGMYSWQVIENNYFINNSSQVGGAFYSGYSRLITQNNVFYGNEAIGSGGAVYLEGNDTQNQHSACLKNNSFSHNSAYSGGAIYSFGVNPIILNSIFWQDTANAGCEIRIMSHFVELAYCNIDTSQVYFNPPDQMLVGDGMINQDPLFIDTLLNIDESSPCVDVGTEKIDCHGETWEAPLYDIMNYIRPWLAGFDMGAYEYGSVYPGTNDKKITNYELRITNYPNPFMESMTFHYKLTESSRVKVEVFNSIGQFVDEPVNATQAKGEHQVQWNAGNLPAGMYYYRMQAGQQSGSGKMVKY